MSEFSECYECGLIVDEVFYQSGVDGLVCQECKDTAEENWGTTPPPAEMMTDYVKTQLGEVV